jgi:hypothetical protein
MQFAASPDAHVVEGLRVRALGGDAHGWAADGPSAYGQSAAISEMSG